MKKLLRAIYDNIEKLPNPLLIFIMRFNISPRLTFGKKYHEVYKSLKNKNDNFEIERLLEVVNIAYENVPFYKEQGEVFISSIEDFEKKVGTIDKDKVLEDFSKFINPTIDTSNFDAGTTGGTSGKPLKLIMDPNRYIVELATMHYLWSQVGYDFDTRAVIRNHKLPENEVFTVNPITKEIIFDGFKLNDDYFEKVYSILLKYRVKFIHCYPSTAYEFSKFLLKYNKDVSFIRSFLCGSENVVEYQRDFIVNKLKVSFYSFYGHSEKLALAGSVLNKDGSVSENYIFEPSYGYVELLDDCGNVIREVGKVGEIVGTTLNNLGMPLIRYKTGDFASYVSMSALDTCGRDLPVIGPVLGRWAGDKIYNYNGTFVTTTALNLHSDVYEKIDGMQYIQDVPGELKVLIIKGSDYTEMTESLILEHFHGALSADAKIEIGYVESLTKKNNGKFLLLQSSLKEQA